MFRRLVVVGSAMAVGFTLFGGGTAGAGAPPVNASGSLTCAISGKGKISPPLVTGAAGTSQFTAKLKSSSCSGSSGVTSFKGTLTATLPTNCLGILTFPAASVSQKVKLKGNQKFNPTALSFTAGGAFTVADPILLNLPGAGSSSATGSFAGQNPALTLVAAEGVAQFATNCQPKTKGVKGSGGLKKMTFTGASSLNIPA
jgi:hypothetical protein